MRVPPPLPSTVIWHASAFPLVVLQDDTWEDMETMLDDAAEEAELIQKWWPQRALALGSVIDKRTGSGNVRQVKIVYAGRAKDHAVWENHKAHLPSSPFISPHPLIFSSLSLLLPLIPLSLACGSGHGNQIRYRL